MCVHVTDVFETLLLYTNSLSFCHSFVRHAVFAKRIATSDFGSIYLKSRPPVK